MDKAHQVVHQLFETARDLTPEVPYKWMYWLEGATLALWDLAKIYVLFHFAMKYW